MRRVYCDLHLHSCLSPCGDDSMTPAMAAGMLKLAGIDVAALTDHNTVGNCPAFFKACLEYGVAPIAGMELTTAEDIHLVCLMRSLEAAMEFGREIDRRRVKIRNKPQFFGNQLIMDEEDNVVGNEEYLLPNATTLSLTEAFELAECFGAVCYPAHVDRVSNGIIAVLGDMPHEPAFRHVEFRDTGNIQAYTEKYPRLAGMMPLFGSDAHSPEGICDASFSVEIPDVGSAAEAVFDLLREARCERTIFEYT